MPAAYQWTVSHASATGPAHRSTNLPCQDHSCFLLMPRVHPDTIVAAVADGLGSAEHGATGAKVAAESACAHASHLLWQSKDNPPDPDRIESILNASLIHARVGIEQTAQTSRLPLASLGTTLLLFIHTRGLIAAIQVGDGAAIVSTEPEDYRTLLTPQRGEYANETTALTTRRAIQQAQLTIARPHKPLRDVALTTDGLLNITMDMASLQPHPPFFTKMTNWLRDRSGPQHPNAELRTILQSDFISTRTHDDVTLLLAVRKSIP